jgi:hypothetical protein
MLRGLLISIFVLIGVAAIPAIEPPAVPVLVELFTSEGCSDCPPADEVLQRLEAGVAGVEVVVMGEHVTYWDRLGWKDRFSADVFTQRQEQYGRRFHLNSVYTPQMVVNGQAEFVGSDEARARREIVSAAKQTAPKIELRLAGGDSLAITASGLPAQAKGAEVILAVTETRLDTDVQRGENGGRKLRHTGVARSLKTVGRVSNANYSAVASYRLDPSWKRENVKLVVFLQDPVSRKILGAAAVRP